MFCLLQERPFFNQFTEQPTPEDIPDTTDGKIKIIDYSERAIAVIGETKPIKDTLKELGGRFNFRLTCGPGWIFSKNRLDAVTKALKELKASTAQTAEVLEATEMDY